MKTHNSKGSDCRCSARTLKLSRCHLESLESLLAIMAFKVQVILNVLDKLEIDKAHPLAFAATDDPGTMYLDQVLKEPDRNKFLIVMEKEKRNHEQRREH